MQISEICVLNHVTSYLLRQFQGQSQPNCVNGVTEKQGAVVLPTIPLYFS